MPKKKPVKYSITAVLEFDRYLTDDPDFNPENLVSEMIKVKTGTYENAVTGYIESIQKI